MLLYNLQVHLTKGTYGLNETITILAWELEEFCLLFEAHFGSGALSCAHLRLPLCP
jgi:hypothetical protein